MVKIEDIQQYGKEHFDTVVASATTLQTGLQAIASAYGDYTKKSYEDTKAFAEKLSGVKSLDKAIEAHVGRLGPIEDDVLLRDGILIRHYYHRLAFDYHAAATGK